MAELTPAAREVRRRLLHDYRYYAAKSLVIRAKNAQIVPLKLNAAQQILQDAIEEELASRGYVRIIILKGRQQGLSTHVGGYLYFNVSQKEARKAMVITHHSDSTRALFDMTKRYHDNVPAILRPSTKYSSRKELSFDRLDSSYTVATAGGDQAGRGETITDLHASELAFWKASKARELWNGLYQAVPETPGTNVFVESTANGVSGLFYELWKGAVEGTNGFRAVFIPWFLQPEYRSAVPEGFERTPDEEELVIKYNLDDEQLQWRRIRIAQNGLDLFRQEYPCYPEEAFLTTGRPVFNPETIYGMMEDAKDTKPHSRLALEGHPEIGFEWNKHSRGELEVFEPHDPSESYYIGADVGLGVRNGDWSVATVMDSRKRVVARYRAQVDPDYYAYVLNELGLFYNEARIIVENNNHGILTCNRLGKDLAYPDFYIEEVLDKTTDKITERLGFYVSVKTKPLIIDQLRADLRNNELSITDEVILRELSTYIVNESGAMEAEEGCHDDCVMSLALCNFIHEGYFEPIPADDDWYVEAI
ncbi:hypothetical protein [Pyruvatibacter mobilis]|uniref:hypothetical protein n=1 Tax=Pyruvatibacter mobilis TaxID=1712261 RepID=UPI003BA93290